MPTNPQPTQPGPSTPGSAGQPPVYPGQQPPQPSAAEMAAHLSARASAFGLGSPLPAVAASMVGYVVAVAASVITALCLLLVGLVDGVSSGSISGITLPDVTDAGTAWVLFALPFQLAAMGGLGVLSGVYEGERVFSLLLVPLLPLLGLVLGSFFGGRIIQRLKNRPGVLHIVLSSVLGGFVVAIIGTLIAFILALRDSGARVDASGVATFFGLWFVVSLSVAVGQFSGAQRPRWWAAVSELFVAFKAALLHGVILAVVGIVALTLYLLVSGEMEFKALASFVLLLPLVGALLGGLIISLLSLAGISVSGYYGPYNETMTVTLFSTPWWVILLSLPVGFAVLLLISLLWSGGRFTVPGKAGSMVVSWVALPVAYFVSALGLMLVGRMAGQAFDLGGLGFSIGAGGPGGGVGMPGWFPLLAFFWGLVVELIARFAGPFVLPFVPARLTSWFRRSLLTRSFYPAPEGALQATRPIMGVDLSHITANAAGGSGGESAAAGAGVFSAPSAGPASSPIAPQQPVLPVNSANPTGPMYPGQPPVQPGQGPVQPGQGPVQPGQGPVQPGQGPVRADQLGSPDKPSPPAPPVYPGT